MTPPDGAPLGATYVGLADSDSTTWDAVPGAALPEGEGPEQAEISRSDAVHNQPTRQIRITADNPPTAAWFASNFNDVVVPFLARAGLQGASEVPSRVAD